tara:strand:+ start:47 stop:583 length:537 start_codon:yes stop_codon:yes gene_type:complete
MGQDHSTILNLNNSINLIILNILNKYSVLINSEIINIIIKIYDDKINNINSELYKSFYFKVFNNKKYDSNEFKNYIKNKILLIFKINKYLENCDQKLSLIYGSNWNSHVSSNYKCNLGSLYHIIQKLKENKILTNKELKSLDENCNLLINNLENLHKNFFINKLKISKKDKTSLIANT